MPTSEDVRRRLLGATARLVYRDGVGATGVESIVAEAGVAKMSLYRHFPGGKDQLVAAALAELDERTVSRLLDEARRHLPEGVEPAGLLALLAVFDAMHEWLQHPQWRGCRYLNAAAELPADHPVVAVVERHKRRLRGELARLLTEAGVPPAALDEVADQVLLLVDGALVTSRRPTESCPARTARAAVATIVAARAAGAASPARTSPAVPA